MKNLRGKNALLTGGSRGLGPYIARALAREGVNIALTARTEGALHTVAEEVTGLGVQVTVIPADITDRAARENLVERAKAAMGQVDILVNNAGMELLARYTSLSADFIESMIETNLVASLILTRLILPDMLKRGSGHIVSMSSLGGKKGSPYSATYAGTKAALIEWSSGLREELRETGVSASVICPGFVADAGMFAVYGKRAPLIAGETTPEKVAQAVVRAIREDIGEIVVNRGPVRLMMVMNAIHPGIMSWIFKVSGVYAFFRQQADENEKCKANS